MTTRMDSPWLLLISTVPAEPSRKRAYVWREVKKVGAVYLRDEEDLTKLRRWLDQVHARDYFREGSNGHAERLLTRCGEALAEFLEAAMARDVAT